MALLPLLGLVVVGCVFQGFCARHLLHAPTRVSARASGAGKTIGGVPVYNYCQRGATACLSSVPNQWVLVLKPSAKVSVFHSMCKSVSARCRAIGSNGGVPFVTISATETLLSKMVSRHARSIAFIEPNLKVRAITSRPVARSNVEGLPWGLERIGVQDRRTRGRGVHVYVLDTGIHASHQDFGGRGHAVVDMTIVDGTVTECDGTANSTCAKDGQGHGTHCAGTIAGAFYGVAPDANVYGVKVLGDGGGGSMAGVMGGMDWVAMNGARPAVASMSLGGRGKHEAQHVAIEAMTNAGVIVVVAGGNDNSDACGFSPAFSPAAFTVGASTIKDARASFSNFGKCVDIWGPGENILSLGITSDDATDTMSGTSMACPHVSGGAALVLSANPFFTPAEVKAELTRTALGSVLVGLKRGDTNDLLFVGPPSPKPSTTTVAPGTCPEFAENVMSDVNGDCKCPSATQCKEPTNFFGMILQMDCTYSGGKSDTYFSLDCDECHCMAGRRL